MQVYVEERQVILPSDFLDRLDCALMAAGLDEWLDDHTPGWTFNPYRTPGFSNVQFANEEHLGTFLDEFGPDNPFRLKLM